MRYDATLGYDANRVVEAIRYTVRLGGDTDTTSAIAGATLGAHYGTSGVFKEWVGGFMAGLKGSRETLFID